MTMQQTNLKLKAAVMLQKKPSAIESVVEHSRGASVQFKNGNKLQIPLEHWIGKTFD